MLRSPSIQAGASWVGATHPPEQALPQKASLAGVSEAAILICLSSPSPAWHRTSLEGSGIGQTLGEGTVLSGRCLFGGLHC